MRLVGFPGVTWLLRIGSRLPGLNEIISSSATATRGWSGYNTLKQRFTAQVILFARVRGLTAIGPGFFTYLFVEPDRRRDPSNVVGGGVKLIEDALQAAELLPNDGWQHVLGYVGYWTVGARPCCLVSWSANGIETKEAMMALLEKEKGHGTANDGRRTADDEPPGAHASKTARPRNARARGKLDRRA